MKTVTYIDQVLKQTDKRLILGHRKICEYYRLEGKTLTLEFKIGLMRIMRSVLVIIMALM